ncbi:MAG: response regulator transcription factor [Deltaproteobacteria bacterium]|nr:response regulator transcription factor [Deltaproteobacteria bacterium]
MPIRLVVADDHPLILDGVENLFRLEEDFQLLARCKDGIETLNAVRRHKPDVVILDIRMPGKDGLTIAREMLAEKLPTRVVLLTAELEDDQLLEAIRAGVRGIVLKEMAPQLLVQCVRKVHAGEQWIERRSTAANLEKILRREAAAREIEALITPREISIVKMVAQDLRNKEIAGKLFIAEGTVKVHLHNICEKLQVKGRLALLRYAREKGLV